MIGTDDAKLFESGVSSVVGTVDADGLPDASRAWGTWTLHDGTRLRFLVPATDERTIENLRTTKRVALTVTDPLTLRSIQVKGAAEHVGEPTADDLALKERYVATFFSVVHEADGSDVALLRNLVPPAYLVVECTIAAAFDQTPGPTAGHVLRT